MENIFLYLSIILATLGLILSGIALFQMLRLKKNQEQLFSGKQAISLEHLMLDLTERTNKLDKDIEDLFSASNQINALGLKGLSKVGLVRFNPYSEKGHKDCFAVALLNNKNQGITLSTLTTDKGTRLFIKKVENGKADVMLTKEETKAIEKAA